MKRKDTLEAALRKAPAALNRGETVGLLLDSFADKVDGRIQTKLISDLMTRYVETARLLEEKNVQLTRSDARRREAQKTAMLGDWEFDIREGTVLWSESMSEILETDSSVPITPETYYQKVHPGDRKLAKRTTERLMKGIVPREHRYRLLMEDGRVKWIRVRYAMQPDANGKPAVARGTLQDITEEKLTEDKLKLYNTKLEEMVQEKVGEIASSHMATIYALVKLSESRDDDTGNHIERTSTYCKLIAEKLREHGVYDHQINDEFIHNITMASPLHDIGKVGIPDAILLKPARLTPEEFEVMKSHVVIGYQTLASLETRYSANSFLRFGMDIARYHHEKWDGSGYMEGLAGESIPLSARIMALSDVYDALRSRRVYKEPFTHDRTVKIIMEGSGTHFDPAIAEVFSLHHQAFAETFDRLA